MFLGVIGDIIYKRKHIKKKYYSFLGYAQNLNFIENSNLLGSYHNFFFFGNKIYWRNIFSGNRSAWSGTVFFGKNFIGKFRAKRLRNFADFFFLLFFNNIISPIEIARTKLLKPANVFFFSFLSVRFQRIENPRPFGDRIRFVTIAQVRCSTGKRNFNVKKIAGIKVVNAGFVDGTKTDLIHARISWRPVTVSGKKVLYTVSWTPESCEDETKAFRAKVPVSLRSNAFVFGETWTVPVRSL